MNLIEIRDPFGAGHGANAVGKIDNALADRELSLVQQAVRHNVGLDFDFGERKFLVARGCRVGSADISERQRDAVQLQLRDDLPKARIVLDLMSVGHVEREAGKSRVG